MASIKVSVVCITYNHKPFIRKCLDGFVMQQTKFPFEILVHDDASTDGTTEIVREYAEKYPNIVPFYEEKKPTKNFLNYRVFPAVQGEYVALCEGDDYWTDPLKLQKQVDYLDANPECSICFHPVTVHYENQSEPDRIFPTPQYRFNKTLLTFKDLQRHNFIQTNSVMYRWRFHTTTLRLLPDHILPADWFWHLVHAQVGNIGFIDDVMGVYRKHNGGIWYGAWQTTEWFKKYGMAHLRFFDEMEKCFQVKAPKERDTLFLACYTLAKKQSNAKWIQQLEKFGAPKKFLLLKLYIKYILCTILEPFTSGMLREKIRKSRSFFSKIFL